MDFAVSADNRVKWKESEKKDKYLDLAREWKKTVEHESDGCTNCNWCSWYSHPRIDKGTGVLWNEGGRVGTIQTTTLRSARILSRVISQTPEENHQLTLMWKTLKRGQMTSKGTTSTSDVNTKHGLGNTTNLHYTAILGATFHKEDIGKEW